ncbi:hypothetical protein [Bradyrhizobium sp. S3.2.6]|uniref:hypothetical protein n=1 Tax=Bradyrhizobium sp. S3.2.6 TaxID=3156428 RepID=UPI003398AD0A
MSLTGEIEAGDGVEFEKQLLVAREMVVKKRDPDFDDRYSTMPDLDIRLDLSSNEGGDLGAALKIAQIVRDEGISTLVRKGRSCASACAFIFLAGEIHQAFSDPAVSRTLEPGGYVFFHSPHPRRRLGTFAEGRIAVRTMLQVLGPRLKADLAVQILLKEPTEYLSIDTIADAVKWEVKLEKFRIPWPRRAGLLQACRNYLELKQNILVGDFVAKRDPTSTEQPVETSDEDNNDADNSAAVPQKLDALTALEHDLLPEGSSELERIRTEFNAPNLSRLIYIGNGEVASQFIFTIGEGEPIICTIWSSPYGLNVSRNERLQMTAKSLGREATYARTAHIPYWYEFPPDTALSAISADFEQ